ncbi:MAG: capsule assembly Wzi family protein [Candidatus Eisenbacteria bacterium]
MDPVPFAHRFPGTIRAVPLVAILALSVLVLAVAPVPAHALELPASRWSVWREPSHARHEPGPASGSWEWRPILFLASAYASDGRAILPEEDGLRLGASSAAYHSGVVGAIEAGGTYAIGSKLRLDAAIFGTAGSEAPSTGRLQELALRFEGERYGGSVGRTRLRWGPGHLGSILAGRAAPPRWQIQGWTAHPLRIPGTRMHWSGSLFLAYLDDAHRVIDDPLFFGQRLTWHPTSWMEITGARTILLGGEDRTSRLTARDLWNILTGTNENLPGAERTAGDSDQRASATLRLRVPVQLPVVERVEGFYEYAGEDMLHPPIPSAVAHHNGVAVWCAAGRGASSTRRR